MRAFHHETILQHPTVLAFRRAIAIVLGIAVMGVGWVAQADSATEGATAKSATVAVSGASDPPGAAQQMRRSSFAATTASYLGMTRTSERQKIESIDPTSWLTRFGDVRTSAVR